MLGLLHAPLLYIRIIHIIAPILPSDQSSSAGLCWLAFSMRDALAQAEQWNHCGLFPVVCALSHSVDSWVGH